MQAAQLEIDRRNRVRHGCGDTRYVADPCREALAATSTRYPSIEPAQPYVRSKAPDTSSTSGKAARRAEKHLAILGIALAV